MPLNQPFQAGIPVYDQQNKLMGYTKLWRKDTDGCIYFDYLQSFMVMRGIELNPMMIKATLEPDYKLIKSGLAKYNKVTKEYGKYKWMANYYNEVLSEYPNVQLDKF